MTACCELHFIHKICSVTDIAPYLKGERQTEFAACVQAMGCLWRVIEAQSWRCTADNICLSVRRAGGLERWGNTGRQRQKEGAGDRVECGPTDQKALPPEEIGDSQHTAPPPSSHIIQALSNASSLVGYSPVDRDNKESRVNNTQAASGCSWMWWWWWWGGGHYSNSGSC